MFIGIAVFEIHIPHSHSLKEKRMVVKSLRDRIRSRFEVSAAEVGAHDLHQRGRIGIAVVSSDATTAENVLRSIEEFVEGNLDGTVIGWTNELVDFDDDIPLTTAGLDWQ
jgi:Uncharacterized protein conserved in bacteria